jgi:hypothetical protein
MNIQWIKGKVIPVHTVKACGGIGDVAPLIINLDKPQAPAALSMRKTLLPIEQEAAWTPNSNSVVTYN